MIIPRGEFGAILPEPASNVSVDVGSAGAVGSAVSKLGGALATVAETSAYEEKKARISRTTALMAEKYTTMAEMTMGSAQQLDRGDPREQVLQEWQTSRDKIFEHYDKQIPPEHADVLATHNANIAQKQDVGILQPALERSRKQEVEANYLRTVDSIAKQIGMPNVKTEDLVKQVEGLADMARSGGIPEARLRDQIDKMWSLDAHGRIVNVERGTSTKPLDQIIEDLNGDYYKGKIDPQQRIAALNESLRARQTIEYRNEHALLKKEMTGTNALNQYENVIANGVTLKPEVMAKLQRDVQGTPSEEDFKKMQGVETVVQARRNFSDAENANWIDEQYAKQDTQGVTDIKERLRLDILAARFKKESAQRALDPVTYLETKTGNESLPLGDLFTPDMETTARLQDRVISVDALRGKIPGVHPNYLKAADARDAAFQLEGMSSNEQIRGLQALSQNAGTPYVFRSIMQQISKDSPVIAYAGLIGGEAGQLLLVGNRLLNKTKAVAGEDGKPIKLFGLPEDRIIRDDFSRYYGDMFASHPELVDLALQLIKAHSVGVNITKNGGAGQIETDAIKASMKATIGEVDNFHGKNTIMPLGMSTSEFNDQVTAAFVHEVTTRGLSETRTNAWPAYQLRRLPPDNSGNIRYAVDVGTRPVTDKSGKDISLTLSPKTELRNQKIKEPLWSGAGR